jgi:hypothetical protein
MLDAEAIKAKLPDVAGIEQLAITLVGDRAVAAFNGITTSVAHNASEDQMIAAIRNAASLRVAQLRAPNETALELSPQPLPVKGPSMSNPAPGGFAAGLKAILDRARASVAEAQADGLAKVNAAADKLAQAGAQVTLVSETMAAQIHEQADAVLAELGQISNMPPVDGQ